MKTGDRERPVAFDCLKSNSASSSIGEVARSALTEEDASMVTPPLTWSLSTTSGAFREAEVFGELPYLAGEPKTTVMLVSTETGWLSSR